MWFGLVQRTRDWKTATTKREGWRKKEVRSWPENRLSTIQNEEFITP
jgi:hypothetical protein